MKSIGKKRGVKLAANWAAIGLRLCSSFRCVTFFSFLALLPTSTSHYFIVTRHDIVRRENECAWRGEKKLSDEIMKVQKKPQRSEISRVETSWMHHHHYRREHRSSQHFGEFYFIAVLPLWCSSKYLFFLRSVHTPPKSRKRWRCELGKGSDTLKHSRLNGT